MGTDTATLIERSARLRVDDLDLGVFHHQPLDQEALRCLRYMHDVEGHTMCYLRDVLVTKAHRDPEVTAFLACWSYEEHWHGDAIAKVLDAHGELSGMGRLAEVRRRLPKRDSLRRIMRQEGRHIDFYSAEARRRLGSSRLSQRITRGALEHFWKPVGSGVMPAGEVRFLISHLFGDEEGEKVAQRIDRQVDRFPGLEGLHLVEKAVTRMRHEAA